MSSMWHDLRNPFKRGDLVKLKDNEDHRTNTCTWSLIKENSFRLPITANELCGLCFEVLSIDPSGSVLVYVPRYTATFKVDNQRLTYFNDKIP